ncbi:SMI1/KNR4 family protein [Nocardiopsis suaedae]|uniref:SMI1/KNR4 family protein n=1 Tax=Nocardiopsis suaedae TaxID=3018444 RepID=A0ABT4TU65_9ACTN|nr:SMI1/KNR4 family protein [Nocardiopsis suaedae]MDA2808232.1 SMI1/KNR4 family protein [Nocardiopsis suaedae]
MMDGAPLPESSVPGSWARIDAWLYANAPADHALLRPPADPEAVEAAQAEMGMRFPPDLLASLACHDGMEGWRSAFPGRPPAPVDKIVEHWHLCNDIYEDLRLDDEDVLDEDEEPWWHPSWIPWAVFDGDSDVIDMRPGPGQGRLGNAEHDDRANFLNGWPSLGAYLAEVADVLENGGRVGGFLAPRVDSEGRLHWERAL